MKALKASADTHPRYKTPRRIYDIEADTRAKSGRGAGDPKQVAEAVLKKVAGELDIKPDLSQLKFDRVKDTILGKHVLFQQQFNGLPISGAWVRVDIDKSGQVYEILNDLIPEKVLQKADTVKKAAPGARAAVGAPAAPPKDMSAEEAVTLARQVIQSPSAEPLQELGHELVYYPYKDVPTPAWKVILKATRPAGEWKVYLHAQTGAVLELIDLLKSQDGRGRVFDPHPMATLNDTTLEDDASIPDAAYADVTLRDLPNTGFLDGPFVTTKRTANRVKQANLDFRFKRPDKGFKEVMVYYHIDRVQRYLQELGFDNVLNKPIEVNVDGAINEDNSFYSPSTKSLTFGRGGVDDAEDAEIILHEYGHAIQDDQVPGWGPSGESRAMGEGFGDYLAASFFAEAKPERLRPCVGSWDAAAYSGDDPPNLRRMDSNKKYPRDMVGEEHSDGEIWAACLWEVRAALGGRVADKLVVAHHFQLAPRASFEDAAKGLMTVDKVLNEGRNEEAIKDVFVRRGILPNAKRKNKRAGLPFEVILRHTHRKGDVAANRPGVARATLGGAGVAPAADADAGTTVTAGGNGKPAAKGSGRGKAKRRGTGNGRGGRKP
jgi:Zn-dependent metalloprotease